MRWVLLLAAAAALVGCVEYEEEMVLKEDGSGSVTLKYTFSKQMTQMIEMSKATAKEGEDGKAPAAGRMKSDLPLSEEEAKDAVKDVEGVTLKEFKSKKTEDGRLSVRMVLEFTDWKLLLKTKLEKTFKGLSFKKNEDGSFLYERKQDTGKLPGGKPGKAKARPGPDKTPDAKPAPSDDGDDEKGEGDEDDEQKKMEEEMNKKMEELQKMMEEKIKAQVNLMLAGSPLSLTYKVTLPKPVAEANTETKEGNSVTWKFVVKNYDDMQNLKKNSTMRAKTEK